MPSTTNSSRGSYPGISLGFEEAKPALRIYVTAGPIHAPELFSTLNFSSVALNRANKKYGKIKHTS